MITSQYRDRKIKLLLLNRESNKKCVKKKIKFIWRSAAVSNTNFDAIFANAKVIIHTHAKPHTNSLVLAVYRIHFSSFERKTKLINLRADLTK